MSKTKQFDPFDRTILNVKEVEERLYAALDCAFCGCRSDATYTWEQGGFNSFERLANHVQHCSYAPLPKPRDDYTQDAARILTANYVKGKQMARQLPPDFVPPEPSGSGTEDSGPAFLSADKDFATDERVSVKILGFEKVDPSQFDPDTERFGLTVAFKGDSRIWAIKVDSPNHRLLSSQLGPVKTWIGKSVTIARMKGKFPNPFIGVLAAAKKK